MQALTWWGSDGSARWRFCGRHGAAQFLFHDEASDAGSGRDFQLTLGRGMTDVVCQEREISCYHCTIF